MTGSKLTTLNTPPPERAPRLSAPRSPAVFTDPRDLLHDPLDSRAIRSVDRRRARRGTHPPVDVLTAATAAILRSARGRTEPTAKTATPGQGPQKLQNHGSEDPIMTKSSPPPASPSEPTTAPDPSDAPNSAPSGAPTKVYAHLQAQPAGNALTATEIALATGLGRSTVGKALTALAKRKLAVRQPGAPASGHRNPDRWTAAGTSTRAAENKPASAAPESRQLTADGRPKRRAPGKLRERVLEFLQERPDEEWGPTGLSRKLEASSGAISNALDKLVLLGQARQTSDRPRRFTAVPASEPEPAKASG